MGQSFKPAVMKPLRITLLNLLMHPAMLAFPVAALLILLLPDRFSRYEVKLVSRSILTEGFRMETHDLDDDGYFEKITFGEDVNTTFVTITNAIRTFDQWNLERKPETHINRCIIGDANQDGCDEVYVLTYRSDSLFLSAIDFRLKGNFVFFERFVSILGTPVHIDDQNYSRGTVLDLDGDQSGEVVFTINNGYGKYPRRLFAYDIQRDSLLKSPELGANLSGMHYFQDLNQDGRPDFLIANYASMNYKDTIGILHDNVAYLFALDHRLQFLFQPVKYEGDYVNTHPVPLIRNDSAFILNNVARNDFSSPGNNIFYIYDITGRKKQTVQPPKADFRYGFMIVSTKGGQLILINPGNKIFILSNDLQLIKTVNFAVLPFNENLQFDLDKDGNNEIFARSTDYEKGLILRHDLKHTASFEIPVMNTTFFFYPWQEKPDSPPGFMMQYENIAGFYTYTFNPLSYLLYVIHLLIYFAVLGFVLLVRRLQRKQLKRKFETENQLSELKLLSIYNQINPHFTFNVLNTIGSVILQQKPEVGYELLMKFARMIRNLLSSSDSIFRSLKDEMDFVTDFLELQQARSAAPFDFELQLDPTIDITRPVPKMVLQTHAENAIKHGIIPLKNRTGKLQIALSHEDHHLKITLTDNGVGRQFARQHPTYSTGKGIAILNQTIALLNQRNNHPIIQTIHDLQDEAGEACGTKVVILIPDNYDFGQTHKTKPR